MQGNGIQGDPWPSILLFSISNEELAPAVGHDEADAEEVVGGLEAAGGDVALPRKDVSFVVGLEVLRWGRGPYTEQPRSRRSAVGLEALVCGCPREVECLR